MLPVFDTQIRKRPLAVGNEGAAPAFVTCSLPQGYYPETVINGETGIHFHRQTTESLIEALDRFDRWLPGFDPAAAVANARRFDRKHFLRDFAAEVARAERRVAADSVLAGADE